MYENGVLGEDGELIEVLGWIENPIFFCYFCMAIIIFVCILFLFPLFIAFKVIFLCSVFFKNGKQMKNIE